jgi:hypothetical protein
MATFLTTFETTSELEKVIRGAQARLTLITPYLKLHQTILDRLKDADARGVEISLVYGKEELTTAEQEKLSNLTRLRLYFLKDHHAKCYANEQNVIISSMNLHEFSQRNNREMSVLLTAEDGLAYSEARKEIESFLRAAEQRPRSSGILRLARSAVDALTASRSAPKSQAGHCVRCGVGIHYKPTAPLCSSCYTSWAAWENEDYPERFCHRCGEAADTSKAKPLCRDCFRKHPFSSLQASSR